MTSWKIVDPLRLFNERTPRSSATWERILSREFVPQFLRDTTIHPRPNWRQDLNHVLASAKRSFVVSPRTLDHRVLLIEHVHKTVTLMPTTKKSFEVFADGHISEKSQGDKNGFRAPVGTPMQA
jgi:hypothetical protein